jgi:hypothetical protein
MSNRTRQFALLIALLIAVTVGYWMWPRSGPGPNASRATAAGGGRTGRGGSGDTVTDIRLDLLQREHGALRGPDRNPFRFERRASAAAPVRPQAARRAPPVDLAPAGPLPPPPPPPIPLRYIGFLQPRGAAGRVAVLSDGRGNVFDGREGDIIEGRYRLLRVGNDSADLIYLDGRGRQTIRLSGQ